MNERFKPGDVIATTDGIKAGVVISYVGADLAFTNVKGVKVINDPRNFKLYELPPGSRVDETTGKVTFKPMAEADLPDNILMHGRGHERTWMRRLVDEFGESEHRVAEFTDAVKKYAADNNVSINTPGAGGTPMAWRVFQQSAKSWNEQQRRVSGPDSLITRRTDDDRFFLIKKKVGYEG